MAMRTVARRWPGASQVRAILRSGRQQEQQQLQQSRTYASEETYTGKGFEEKEKAAENRYIRQMEEERKLKKASGEASAHLAGQSPVSTPGKVTEAASDSGFRNTAVVAGILAVVVAGYWWVSGSGSSKKEEKEST